MVITASKLANYIVGAVMFLNFSVFWALPIAALGISWKFGFKGLLLPIYDMVDQSSVIRNFAKEYIYTKPEHSDFFAITIFLILNSVLSIGAVFYWQLTYGSLPWWAVLAYFCSWVGIGGRTMGGAYTLAHKEVKSVSRRISCNVTILTNENTMSTYQTGPQSFIL
jgi:hypothetical protein